MTAKKAEELLELVIAVLITHVLGRNDDGFVLHLTSADEQAMMYAPAERIGESLVTLRLQHGVRGAFPTLYGVPVKWGEKERVLTHYNMRVEGAFS